MLVRPLRSLGARDLALAGGKGANLGELVRAGFAVPDGFVLTTEAYDLAVSVADVVEALAHVPHDDLDRLSELGAAARSRILAAPIPDSVAEAARTAYRDLSGGAVAVRSSATAEDLPQASFAGQQDTFLDVRGEDGLLDAIRRCWASLWTDRAVSYRATQKVDPRGVGIAVVVQRMVDARAAGVLFTADPITGRRRRAVVDAIAGLGEELVAGRANPDHYVVETRTGEVLERRLVGERAVLDDEHLRELAAVGDRVERHFRVPQDIEFAVEGSGKLWLLQSRPITTLYPVPNGAPDAEGDLRVYFSFNVAQGVFGPLTPLGIETFRLAGASIAAAAGHPLRQPTAGPSVIVDDPAMRMWLDLTPVFRDPLARRLPERLTAVAEARSSRIFRALLDEPRLAPRRRSRFATLRRVLPALAHTRIPLHALRALARPDATRDRILAEMRSLAEVDVPADASPAERLDAYERLVLERPRRYLPLLGGLLVAAMASYLLARRLLRGRATEEELQTVLRGMPHNPTTEMDLALWALARGARNEEESWSALSGGTPEELARRYRAGTLPRWLQEQVEAFLARYGHRAIAEIDIGVPRWSEDPRHILGAIANYLRLPLDAPAPDEMFDRGAREAEAMIETLLGRVHGPRRMLLRASVRRVRALSGAREAPKFHIVRLFAAARALLAPVGDALASSGRLDEPDDLYFLTLPELRRAAAGEDLHEIASSRRATYRRELERRRVPRVLLSDGSEPEASLAAEREGALRGTAASPGVVNGVARVILEPEGAMIEPGEILVAPSTDPGWTPLFLTAGGLVMEMGGMMSHGAVVAREYGIPAVVGVAGATERIATGHWITVDGSHGVVGVDGEEPA